MSVAGSEPTTCQRAGFYDGQTQAVPRHVREPSADTLAVLASESERLESAAAEDVLAWAIERYFPRFTMATGLGPEGCVIISMLAKIEPRVYVFNLDTGYQFAETLALREQIMAKYRMPIHLERPAETVAEYEAARGGPVYRHDSDTCCRDRKVRVLERVAARFDAWATGVRREQSPTRPIRPIVQWDKKFGMVKVNPWPAGPSKTFGSELSARASPIMPCTTKAIRASAAGHAREPFAPARTTRRAVGAARPKPNAACTRRPNDSVGEPPNPA